MPITIDGLSRQVTEWNYLSDRVRRDPFHEIQLDIVITHEDGESWIVPAFWGGGQTWRVRFAAPRCGAYRAVSKCSDINDPQLHQVETHLSIEPYEGNNPLYKHGPLQVSDSKHHFEYADGKPFFWLGDTWWMGLCGRLSWPEDFQALTADRVKKGFSVIQIVAGLYPDMDSFDERGENEAGFPWKKEFSTINPAYFDRADLRIEWLVKSGLMPCILGSWGYYLFPLGIDKMKQHWRYLIARWGAYPVIWSLAGETSMPYYLSAGKNKKSQQLREGWTQIGHFIGQTDPYARLLTVHPTDVGRDQITDDSFMDFDMLQTGHSGYKSVKNTLKTLDKELDRKPKMPVIIAEVNYEGIHNSNHAEIQRLTFWSSILSGANGFTYGANGVWQVNQRGKPFGNSPGGHSWGDTPWEDAYRLEGGKQLGLAAKLLQDYDWWDFKFHPEWVSPTHDSYDINAAFSAGIPSKVRLIYFDASKSIGDGRSFKKIRWIYHYALKFLGIHKPFKILDLEPNIHYHAHFWNPRNAARHDIGSIQTNKNHEWPIPTPPTYDDWILILEAQP